MSESTQTILTSSEITVIAMFLKFQNNIHLNSGNRITRF